MSHKELIEQGLTQSNWGNLTKVGEGHVAVDFFNGPRNYVGTLQYALVNGGFYLLLVVSTNNDSKEYVRFSAANGGKIDMFTSYTGTVHNISGCNKSDVRDILKQGRGNPEAVIAALLECFDWIRSTSKLTTQGIARKYPLLEV